MASSAALAMPIELKCKKDVDQTVELFVRKLTLGWRWPRMYFRTPVIVLTPTFPHTKIRGSVGSLDVVDQVLNERDLVMRVNDVEARGNHLNKENQVQWYNVNLQDFKSNNE